MPYCQLYYHLVWSTRNREPWITRDVEPTIHGRLRAKAIGLGAELYALDGIEDHVHMVVSIPARLAVAEFIGQVKGATSTWINKNGLFDFRFKWQAEYGAFSIEKHRLHHYVSYVEKQKQHHAAGDLIAALEPPSVEPEEDS